jgi:cation diffusion facilitator family transporter
MNDQEPYSEYGRRHEGHDHEDHHHNDDRHGRGGILGAITSFISPHSHDHVDSLDTALTSSVEGVKALKLSVSVLAAVALIQLGIVLLTGSIALLGDTIHNATDVATAIPLAFAFWLQRRPPNRQYTYGYGRAEDLAGVFVCVIIALSAVATAWIAIDRLLQPQPVTHLPFVALAGVVGFVGNEAVAIYRVRVGRSIGSAALVADGLHARTDGITSLAVVAGAIGVAAGWTAADSVVGLVISVVILNVLRHAAREIFHRLMDSVDPELVGQVEEVLRQVEGIQYVQNVRLRWIGHRLEAEAAIVSDGNISLSAAHKIAEEAHHRLLHEVPRLTYAIIHSDPSVGNDGTHEITRHHFEP